MAWQFGKSEEPPRPLYGLILVVQPSVEELEKERQVRYMRLKRKGHDKNLPVER